MKDGHYYIASSVYSPSEHPIEEDDHDDPVDLAMRHVLDTSGEMESVEGAEHEEEEEIIYPFATDVREQDAECVASYDLFLSIVECSLGNKKTQKTQSKQRHRPLFNLTLCRSRRSRDRWKVAHLSGVSEQISRWVQAETLCSIIREHPHCSLSDLIYPRLGLPK